MTTDGFPQTYIYVSRRIIRELYQQDEARERNVELNVTAKIPGIDVKAAPRKQLDNDYWLVRKVTEAVRDNTGTLLQPGVYVRARMDVTWSEVPFLEGGFRVAWLSCLADTKEGPVFAALCGSLRNFEGYSAGDDSQYRGWYPSAPVGVQKLVSSFSGNNEDVDGAAAWGGGDDAEGTIRTAITISTTLGSGHIAGRAELDVLFQVFSYQQYPRNEGSLRAAMIGTPLWAATCPPLPDFRSVYTRPPLRGDREDEDKDEEFPSTDTARTGIFRRWAQRTTGRRRPYQ